MYVQASTAVNADLEMGVNIYEEIFRSKKMIKIDLVGITFVFACVYVTVRF